VDLYEVISDWRLSLDQKIERINNIKNPNKINFDESYLEDIVEMVIYLNWNNKQSPILLQFKNASITNQEYFLNIL
jgi:hypothetical protein